MEALNYYRDDNELIHCLGATAARVEPYTRDRSFHEVRADPQAREAFRSCALELGATAEETSEMLRNWATHVPWDGLIALRQQAEVAARDEAALRGIWDFLQRELPAVQAALEGLSEPTHLRRSVDPDEEYALDKNLNDFYHPAGSNLLARTEEFYGWVEARRRTETWQYSRLLEVAPGSIATIRNDTGRSTRGINFNSQDYFSLSAHPAIREAALRALHEFGPHSAGSPIVLGNTRYSEELERELGELLHMEHVMLFPTGWAAGFGSIVGLVRQEDYVVVDKLAHACLQQGARAATRNIFRFEHLSLESVRQHLVAIRGRDTRNGILVVTDGLFSVDADWPDLVALQALCREYDATLLVDVAHDLGALGPGGSGVLGMQGLLGQVDLVMGSFSKTFASNGGFLATRSPAVKQYVKLFAGSHLFSNALSPTQAAVVLQSARIVRSPEGELLRERLFRAVHALRDELIGHGRTCMGMPSPIVPLLMGNEKLARITNRLLFDRGVLAFLVEFPVTPVGSARFRLQVQAAHSPEEARLAARIIDGAINDARAYMSSAFGTGLA
ncbi:MAG: aminotransferase class I/II-fold pyridoxal phosphate-dependent enzyme [Hyalangium sp.]|uniref:aminotransferase class I/II-fold pyridoxal phosphate-dependent enzyme n=1 Tax=Hyalangium sp. TaxID=2028555 RepID=UPI003899DEE7